MVAEPSNCRLTDDRGKIGNREEKRGDGRLRAEEGGAGGDEDEGDKIAESLKNIPGLEEDKEGRYKEGEAEGCGRYGGGGNDPRAEVEEAGEADDKLCES